MLYPPKPLVHFWARTETAKAFGRVARPILDLCLPETVSAEGAEAGQEETNSRMVVAVPLAGDSLALHFGHCDEFAFFEVDPESKAVLRSERHRPPEHEPGVLPNWLAQRGVSVVSCGGMGARAQSLLAASNIHVMAGAPAAKPDHLVKMFLSGALELGENVCDH